MTYEYDVFIMMLWLFQSDSLDPYCICFSRYEVADEFEIALELQLTV